MAGTVAQSATGMAGTPSHERESEELAGYSLLNLAELLFPCLDAVAPATVVEIGAYRGTLTAALLEWAQGSQTAVTAIDPDPHEELLALIREHPELTLVRKTSHEALAQLPPADALILDGDHNYFTLSEELRLIAERSADGALPTLLFHDVCWPHARRDTYYAPERIPEEHRKPIARDAAIAPGNSGIAEAGLHYPYAAAREGGPRNGVLTAIEDFVADREGLRLAIVPAFFGFGVLWRQDVSYAEQLAELLDPYDRNPILERLEANRVSQMIAEMRDHLVLEQQQATLRSLLHSRAFTLAEWISRLKQRGEPIFSRRQVKRLLGERD